MGKWNALWDEAEYKEAARKVKGRTNFNDKEAASIYYGIIAVAHKMKLSLDTKEGITSAVNNFLSGMSWSDCSKFNVECVTGWTHLFAERDVTYEPSLSLIICHAMQKPTLLLVALMAVPISSPIGTERGSLIWGL